jgi:hypothetical protein
MLNFSGGKREVPVGVEAGKVTLGYRWDLSHFVALQLAGLRLKPQEKRKGACSLRLVASYPLMQPTARSLATFLERPAP